MPPAHPLSGQIVSSVEFSGLCLEGSLCLLISLLPFSRLAQESGQAWAHEELGRQRQGNVAGTGIPEPHSVHTVGTEDPGLPPGAGQLEGASSCPHNEKN